MDHYDPVTLVSVRRKKSLIVFDHIFCVLFFLRLDRLAIRLPNLESNLNESKIVHSLLTAIGISPDMILSTTKYLVEHPLEELPPAASQTTSTSNFEDVD